MPDPRRRRGRLDPQVRIDLALAALVLALTAPVIQTLEFQQSSRMALTAAIWEEHTLVVDGYLVGDDRAEHDGHTYSDKAPGQPVLAVPLYAVQQALGGRSYADPTLERNMGLWWISLWCAALPAAALAVVVRRVARRYDPAVATPVAVAVSLSTLLLPFGSVLFGHVLSTLLAFGGWALATSERDSRRRAVAAGVLLGLAVAVEYTMVFAAVAVVAFLAVTQRRRVLDVVAGALPIGLLVAAYQWAAFGSPFTISYGRSTYAHTAERNGLPDVDLPLLPSLVRVLVGERGLFIVTPVLAVAVAGTVVLLRQLRGRARWAIAAAALTSVALIGVQVAWSNPTGGDSPGARYATAAAAFLVPGLTVGWVRWRLAAVVTAVIGGVFMVAATWTNPLTARDTRGAIRFWVEDLLAGRVTDSVYAAALGRPGWLAGLGVIVAAAAWLLWSERAARLSRPRGARASGP